MRLNFIIMLTVFLSVNYVSASSENNGTALEDIDGDMLIDLGRQMNKPMLTVIGMAIRNLRKLNPCGYWTTWSKCGATRVGYIGRRSRKRKCKLSQPRSGSGKTRDETEIGFCEGICPNNYNATTNGFCIKLYVGLETHDDAEKRCQGDGGFLINIDSEKKFEDVKTVLQGFSEFLHIGGQRKDVDSAWEFLYGFQAGFFKWISGEPSSSDTSMVLYSANSRWYGVDGTGRRPFLCEIIG